MKKINFIISIICTLCCQSCFAILEPLNLKKMKFSLCDCVLETVKQYVKENETITVASSITDYSRSTKSVVTTNEMLLWLLTNHTKWTFLTMNMASYADVGTSYTLEKISKNYIIFMRNSGEISTNIKKLKTLNSWNPHSRFLVISSTTFRDPVGIAKEVLQTLWEEELLNGVVLLSNPSNTSVFDVYTSKPYAKGNCGKSLGGVEIIDSCIKGVFQRRRYLFKNDVPENLSNCVLPVGFVKVEPYVLAMKNNSISNRESYNTDHGIEINLLNMIANYLNVKLVYYQAYAGRIYLNGSATDNLLLLKQRKVDIAVGFYIRTFSKSYYFDCSGIYVQDKLTCCVPHSPFLINSQNFFKLLNVTCWLLLVFVYLVTVSIVWYASRVNGSELRPYRNYKSVSQYVFSIFLGFPVRFQPKTFRIRMLFSFIVFFSFHLDTAYLSSLASVLTGSRYGEKYGTVNDIYKYNLKTYFAPNSGTYFQDSGLELVLKKMIECYNYKECMDNVAFRRDSSFCVSKLYTDYIRNSYVSRSNDPLIYCFGNIVTMKANMLMRKGYPLFSRINDLISQITSAGFITKWRKDILRTRAGNFVADIDIEANESRLLELSNLMPVFIALLVGQCLSFLVFIIELKYGGKIPRL